MIEVVIDCIRMSLMSQNRVVILKEKDRDRYLPIWIGHFEADAITFALQEVAHKRPLTHDLLKDVVAKIGGDVKHIIVTELRRDDEVYIAEIVIDVDGDEVRVDSRPSDAIALAVRVDVPIFVNEEVLEMAGVMPEEDIEEGEIDTKPEPDEDRLQIFKDFVDTLDLDNLEDD